MKRLAQSAPRPAPRRVGTPRARDFQRRCALAHSRHLCVRSRSRSSTGFSARPSCIAQFVCISFSRWVWFSGLAIFAFWSRLLRAASISGPYGCHLLSPHHFEGRGGDVNVTFGSLELYFHSFYVPRTWRISTFVGAQSRVFWWSQRPGGFDIHNSSSSEPRGGDATHDQTTRQHGHEESSRARRASNERERFSSLFCFFRVQVFKEKRNTA